MLGFQLSIIKVQKLAAQFQVQNDNGVDYAVVSSGTYTNTAPPDTGARSVTSQ